MNENETVYDRWLKNDPDETNSVPRINSNMGANSDHAMFLQRAGVPCIDQKFVANNVNNCSLRSNNSVKWRILYEQTFVQKYTAKLNAISLKNRSFYFPNFIEFYRIA